MNSYTVAARPGESLVFIWGLSGAGPHSPSVKNSWLHLGGPRTEQINKVGWQWEPETLLPLELFSEIPQRGKAGILDCIEKNVKMSQYEVY